MKMTPSLDDNLDYQDVKLKIVQQEGYDAHDFNLFDDRASQLWRKPYVDGAVQELTSNDNRSSEQLRVAVEQLMLAAGNQNPDVRLTGSAAPKSGATVKVDAEIENEEDVLRDMRAIRLGTLRPAETKTSRARARPSPGPSGPPPQKHPLARPPAIPAISWSLAPTRHPWRSCPILLLAHQTQSYFHPGRILWLRPCRRDFLPLQVHVLPQRHCQLLPSRNTRDSRMPSV